MQWVFLAFDYISPAVYLLALAAAGVSDLVRYKIPNIFSILLVVFFPPIALSAPSWAFDWVDHLGAFAATLAGGLVLWRLGWLGAGDVKLLAATSLWVGLPRLPEFLILVAFAGGAFIVLLIVLRRGLLVIGAMSDWLRRIRLPRLLVSGENVPYGVGISIVGIYYVLDVPVFQHLAYVQGSGL